MIVRDAVSGYLETPKKLTATVTPVGDGLLIAVRR